MPQSANAPLAVTAPKFFLVSIPIRGTVPLVINRFSQKAKLEMREKQQAGSTAKSKKTRAPKDFEAMGNEARHISTEGWDGFSAAAIRQACVSACRTVGVVMTKAKLALYAEADGFDQKEGTPLIRIDGTMKMIEHHVRLQTGVPDLRVRPHYFPWTSMLRIRFDSDMLTPDDVANLVLRVGLQVGIGEGRPDSKNSCGTGNGLFVIDGSKEMTLKEVDVSVGDFQWLK